MPAIFQHYYYGNCDDIMAEIIIFYSSIFKIYHPDRKNLPGLLERPAPLGIMGTN